MSDYDSTDISKVQVDAEAFLKATYENREAVAKRIIQKQKEHIAALRAEVAAYKKAKAENDELERENRELRAKLDAECRLNGMGAEREE